MGDSSGRTLCDIQGVTKHYVGRNDGMPDSADKKLEDKQETIMFSTNSSSPTFTDTWIEPFQEDEQSMLS